MSDVLLKDTADATLGVPGNPLVSGTQIRRVSASKTRPANTTTYASGDVINESASAGTVFTFTNAALANGGGGIIRNVLITSSSFPTTKLAAAELFLFHVAPVADNDNAAATLTEAELANCIGVVVTPATPYAGDAQADAAGSCVYQTACNLPFVCTASSRNIYGVLIARNAYVPVSAEVISITLIIECSGN